MLACDATAGVAPKAARVVFQRQECMLQPGVPNLLKALGVVSSTAHPIEILRNDRVIVIWQ